MQDVSSVSWQNQMIAQWYLNALPAPTSTPLLSGPGPHCVGTPLSALFACITVLCSVVVIWSKSKVDAGVGRRLDGIASPLARGVASIGEPVIHQIDPGICSPKMLPALRGVTVLIDLKSGS